MTDADRELLDHFRRTRQKTIELLARIPDEWLSRTPDGEDHPLYRLLAHTGGSGIHWWVSHVLHDGLEDSCLVPTEKEALQAEMEYWRDRVLAFFTADDGANLGRTFAEKGSPRKWTGRNRLLYFIDHEVHHRGKLTLALRQWGMHEMPFFPF